MDSLIAWGKTFCVQFLLFLKHQVNGCYPRIFLGHKDSVTCVCFSSGSTYLATGDLAGSIKVWGVKQLELIWSFEVSDLEVSQRFHIAL